MEFVIHRSVGENIIVSMIYLVCPDGRLVMLSYISLWITSLVIQETTKMKVTHEIDSWLTCCNLSIVCEEASKGTQLMFGKKLVLLKELSV